MYHTNGMGAYKFEKEMSALSRTEQKQMMNGDDRCTIAVRRVLASMIWSQCVQPVVLCELSWLLQSDFLYTDRTVS